MGGAKSGDQRARTADPLALAAPGVQDASCCRSPGGGLAQLSLHFAEPRGGPPAAGVFGLAFGVALFALGSFGTAVKGREAEMSSPVATPGRVFWGSIPGASLGLGLILVAVLIYRLTRGSESGLDILLWLAAIATFTAPFVNRLWTPRIVANREIGIHVAAVLALVGIFLALNVRDLENWYYAAIGDEYAFYQGARNILDTGISRPFSQDGVYGEHPVLNSAYQAVVMAIAGRDNVGWRFSSVLSVALTIPGIYVLGLTLGNRRVAMFSATLFAFSHYLFAYAHTGYNNIHSLAPAVWALAFFTVGLRRGSPLAARPRII